MDFYGLRIPLPERVDLIRDAPQRGLRRDQSASGVVAEGVHSVAGDAAVRVVGVGDRGSGSDGGGPVVDSKGASPFFVAETANGCPTLL